MAEKVRQVHPNESDITSIDSTELADSIREGLDLEPEEKVEKPEREPSVRKPELEKPGDIETRLTQAMKTIEGLTSRVSDQDRELSYLRGSVETRGKTDTEGDFIEVLPNVRLPKDESKWPIQLTDDDLVKLGWNDEKIGPGRALRALGNALYMAVLQTVPNYTKKMLDVETDTGARNAKRLESFFSLYPDLKDHQDYLEIIERKLRNDNPDVTKGSSDVYYETLGESARNSLARVRGVTREQYDAEVASKGSDTRTRGGSNSPRSRASGPSSSVRGPARKSEVSDLDDIVDEQLGRIGR